MPHALVKDLAKPCFVLNRCTPPTIWMKSDRQLVSLVFLFAVPKTDARTYMNLIYGLARLSKTPHLVESLLAESDRFAILNLLKQVKLRATHRPPA